MQSLNIVMSLVLVQQGEPLLYPPFRTDLIGYFSLCVQLLPFLKATILVCQLFSYKCLV